MLDRSAVVFADGLGLLPHNTAIMELRGRPLIVHVVEAITDIVDEIYVIVSKEREELYSEILEKNIKFVVEVENGQNQLSIALPGFELAQGKYSLLLSGNMPLVSKHVLELLFDLCSGKSAVIPRWPNQQIEPLQAVFHTKTTLEAMKTSLAKGITNVSTLIETMNSLRYVSTLVIQELDPGLKTFFTVNTPSDLKRAEGLLGKKAKIRG